MTDHNDRFILCAEDFDALVALLDAPPKCNPRMAALLASDPPWDTTD